MSFFDKHIRPQTGANQPFPPRFPNQTQVAAQGQFPQGQFPQGQPTNAQGATKNPAAGAPVRPFDPNNISFENWPKAPSRITSSASVSGRNKPASATFFAKNANSGMGPLPPAANVVNPLTAAAARALGPNPAQGRTQAPRVTSSASTRAAVRQAPTTQPAAPAMAKTSQNTQLESSPFNPTGESGMEENLSQLLERQAHLKEQQELVERQIAIARKLATTKGKTSDPVESVKDTTPASTDPITVASTSIAEKIEVLPRTTRTNRVRAPNATAAHFTPEGGVEISAGTSFPFALGNVSAGTTALSTSDDAPGRAVVGTDGLYSILATVAFTNVPETANIGTHVSTVEVVEKKDSEDEVVQEKDEEKGGVEGGNEEVVVKNEPVQTQTNVKATLIVDGKEQSTSLLFGHASLVSIVRLKKGAFVELRLDSDVSGRVDAAIAISLLV